VGRIIRDSYCNGYFDGDYDLYGAEIIAEGDEYLVVRKENGIVAFCNFQTWDYPRYPDGSLASNTPVNVRCMGDADRQTQIDEWCS
jgi:hypothetical protein